MHYLMKKMLLSVYIINGETSPIVIDTLVDGRVHYSRTIINIIGSNYEEPDQNHCSRFSSN